MADSNADVSYFHHGGGHVKMLGFNETLMYGRYTRELSKFARQEAERVRRFSLSSSVHRISIDKAAGRWLWERFIGPVGEDWIFLTLLGIIMALISFAMDFVIERCHTARLWLFETLSFSVIAQYFAWVLFGLVLVCFAVGFTHLIGPNASGSGIPELKTIMRGVVLKEYLTFRTLIAKVVGLSAAIGSGLPIGKEGPFVHVASITATVLARLFPTFCNDIQNQSRKTEILAAACAVGVACTFAAPIGGVLFSIEVTATYFAVRNYWRGFYSAVCGAIMFRFLAIWFHDEATLTALFKTSLRQDVPFDPIEMVSFSVVGIICGFGGASFVLVHKNIVLFIRRRKKLVSFLQKNRFIYPSVVTATVMSCLFPGGLGQFLAGALPVTASVNNLFDNVTWSTREAETYEEEHMLNQWRGLDNNVFITISLFTFSRFWMSAIATTMPMPCGIFIPSFAIGAGIGRLCGEAMAMLFPDGIGGEHVVPGGYAIVGAAAFSGSVTHTVSTAVIVFELTGQIGHILPCVIAVFMANVISKCITASFYDMVIEIKNLPYLHNTLQPNDSTYNVKVEDFMQRDLKVITKTMSYREVFNILLTCHFRYFPLVDSSERKTLLGSIQRTELERLVGSQLSDEKKASYFVKKMADLTSVQNDSRQPPHREDSQTSVGDKESQENQIMRADKRRRFTIQQVVLAANELSNTESDSQIVQLNNNSSSSNIEKNAVEIADKEAPHVHFALLADLHDPDQEHEWEQFQMDQQVCLDGCQVDPAPFQVVAKTSLFKVHSLFSLLNLHHAYVTDSGKLVGIVSLAELRSAIQGQINITLAEKLKTSKCISRKRSASQSQSAADASGS